MAAAMNDYYSLDAIERDAAVVSCVFAIDAAGLGYLEAMATGHGTAAIGESSTLKKGTKVDLPLWLALPLAKRRMVTMSLPPYLSHRFRTSLMADPPSVNLADRCPAFYGVGSTLADVFQRDDIRQDLLQCLVVRFQRILEEVTTHGAGRRALCVLTVPTQAQLFSADKNASAAQVQFRQRLATAETALFNDKIETQMAYRKWRDREVDPGSMGGTRKKIRPST
ncbi:hypothetical protein PBRA_009057 [Plasmodiophora brassicae]|uniref:Uncharacterized protein n=1 Tax=Plasmodiophora brassicae TaxID=37360 RepID=A0A0G4J4A7_PLABS|nr:hypothetical protein PBRA_009057 [Plasmodiophora brassicae]